MMMSAFRARSSRALFAAAATAAVSVVAIQSAEAQLRVVNWNISNYNETALSGSGNRTSALRTAIYGVFEGRSMAPDVILGEEFISQAAVDNFVNVLNGAANSPGDWAAGTFVNGNDTDSAFFYRTSKVTFVQNKTVYTAPGDTDDQPRNTQRFDITLNGYAGTAPAISMYGLHMKAGDSGSDQSRRLLEAQRVRDDAQALPAGTSFLVGGDFNIQSSTQAAYQEFVGSQSNNLGRLRDPIATPGTWNNSSSFRYVHTQDPVLGMDDRLDFVLVGPSLVDGKGLEYIGNSTVPYSTSTWNDPNHSYRAYGNDGGQSLNSAIRTTTNTMVGPTIAQALKDASGSAGGHLPVFLDLRVPAELATSTTSIDFGLVPAGSAEQRSLEVFNNVSDAIWSVSGIDALRYTLLATGDDFAAQAGSFSDPAGGAGITNFVTLTDTTLGMKSGALQIFVDGVLSRTIPLSANVVPEPAMLGIVAFAGLMMIRRRRHS